MARPAAPSAATALPALKPNQPTHSIEAPTTVRGEAVGWDQSVRVAVASADQQRRHQGGDAGVDMDHGPAGKIEHTHIAEKRTGAAPGHVAERRVDQSGPAQRKEQHGRKLHAFGKSPGDQRRRDDGKSHLEGHEHVGRHGAGQAIDANAGQASQPQSTDECVQPDHALLHASGVESQAVAPPDPDQRHQSG